MVKKPKNNRGKRAYKKSTKRSTGAVFKFVSSKRWYFIALAVVVLVGASFKLRPGHLGAQPPPPPADALYRQPNLPIETRVKDLLSYMTLEEKIGQMALVDKNSLGKIEDISKYYLGGVLSGAGAKPQTNTPQGWKTMVDGMKDQATKSRLGIPILYGIDANHGHSNVMGATVFPHAIGLGASQDAALVKDVAAATAQELMATGVNWSYSPSLDAPRDIRWGRVYEAFSDDPQLIATLGQSYIAGTQSASNDGTFVLASAKHFLGTGAMIWNQSNHKKFKIDQGRIAINQNALLQEYLPPYKAAVDAGVSSVMVGLSQWGDQRVIDSQYLVTDQLKNGLGFKGFVVSDWYGIYEYAKTSNYNANIKTINAGVDMAMLPYDYKAFLNDVRNAVKDGSISQSRIDDAVSRILYQKFKAGLFDKNQSSIGLENVGSPQHRLLARQAVASSAVLLKNSDSLLPLSKKGSQILVAGSGADNVGRQSGAWTIEWQGIDGNWMPGGTSILQAIRQEAGTESTVIYEKNGNFNPTTGKADVAIVVVSEKPYAEGWGDNANPTISPEDLQTIERARQVSDKIVVVMLSGRPLLITDHIANWDAAVAAWLPGSEGGGVADVLFGNQPFTGKLPLPWPASTSQLPISADGTTNDNSDPLFGRYFGL